MHRLTNAFKVFILVLLDLVHYFFLLFKNVASFKPMLCLQDQGKHIKILEGMGFRVGQGLIERQV